MDLFHIIDQGQVILKTKGIYKQVAAYSRGLDVYAPHAGGFIRLLARGATTVPHVSWVDVEAPGLWIAHGGGAPQMLAG